VQRTDDSEGAADDAEAFTGDRSWRVVRTLRDGSEVTVRPLAPEDREELRRAFRQTSPRTRYLRFLGVVGDLSDAMLTYLTDVDQDDHIALVATVPSPDLKTERGLGVARLIRTAHGSAVAEAAITVADEWQRRGVGTVLARELGRAARVRGIRTIRADVHVDNEAMRAILEQAGAECVARDEATGTLSYDIAIEPEAKSLLEVLRGAAATMATSLRRLAPASVSGLAAAASGDEPEADEGKR